MCMKAGRPKKNKAEKKTELVAMTVTASDKQKIEAAALKLGLPVSVFIYNQIMRTL